MPDICRLDLWNAYLKAKTQGNYWDVLVEFVFEKIGLVKKDHNWESEVKQELMRFTQKCLSKYKRPAISYHPERFLETYKEWLTGFVSFPEAPPISPQPGTSKNHQPEPGASTSKRGRPKVKDFKGLNEDSKRRRTKSLRQKTETEEMVFATKMKLLESGKTKEAKVLTKVMNASPRTVNMIFMAVEKIKRSDSGNIDDGSPKQFTLEEAIVHQIECDFSKDQYTLNRLRLINKNCKIFPSYEKISEYKKKYCLPNNVRSTEQKGFISLQDMLDHTVKRIIEAQKDVFKSGFVEGTKLQFVCKVGFDGSSNQSTYNQPWKSSQLDDSSLVLTAIVPLILHQKMDKTAKVNVLWINRKPSSIVNCRPLELEFTKETNTYIKNKAIELKKAIDDLEVTIIDVDGKKYEISHCIQITMVDGKIASAMTNTGAATCNVCKATPKEMNSIDSLLLKTCDDSALAYGLPVLHLHIRFLEYLLNIAKRLGVAERCYGKYTKEEMDKMKARHKKICDRIQNELSLNLDKPTSKGGNTNTGNNARRFFDKAVKIAEITNLDLDILQKCRVVLKTFSCGYAVDTEIFQKYCLELARDLVSKYKFWYMPSAIHLALIHGAAIIKKLPVPIGMLSEEPLESSHKVVRHLRLHHTRKFNREATMSDMINGMCVMTDPVIASLRRPAKAKGTLDRRVASMLLGASETGGFPCEPESIVESDDSDIDDHTDM